MDKHQTENPAGKAIHHFKVVGLLGCLPLQPDPATPKARRGRVPGPTGLLGTNVAQCAAGADQPLMAGIPKV